MYARTEAGPWVLYDLKDDPDEMKNRADDPAQVAVRDALERMLAGWTKRTGDSWSLNSMAPVEDRGRLYQFEAFTTIGDYLDWAAKHPDLAPKN